MERTGGNPDNVLIFGQSSGGSSVSAHLIMTESFPLFHKAIIESGSFPSWGTHSWEAAGRNYNLVLEHEEVQCGPTAGYRTEADQLACLLTKDAAAVAAAGGAAGLPCRDGCGWAPVVDGVELTDWPINMVAAGHRALDKPIIQSHCFDDGVGAGTCATFTARCRTGCAH